MGEMRKTYDVEFKYRGYVSTVMNNFTITVGN